MATTQSAKPKKKANGHAPLTVTNRLRVSVEDKLKAVESLNAGGNAEELAATLGVSAASLYGWRKGKGLTTSGTRKKETAPSAPEAGRKTALTHSDTVVRDAILYLRNARAAIMREVTGGRVRDLNEAQLLTLLALKSLEGG